jgi:putative drug exporter of the RND superfamily
MPDVFARLGRIVARRPWTTIGIWFLLTAGGYVLSMGILGDGLFDRLTTGAPEVQGSESQEGSALLVDSRETGPTTPLALTGIDPSDPDLASLLAPLRSDLGKIDGVESVVDPLILPGGAENPVAAPLIAADGDGFLIVVELEHGLDPADEQAASDAVVATLEQVPSDLRDIAPEVDGVVGSGSLIVDAITDQVGDDLETGEVVALPIALVVMLLVFGGFLAAAMPMVGAVASIAGGLATLWLLSFVMEVDASAVNVVTVLGIGLSIDYGLLVVSRYREELGLIVEASDGGARSRRRRGDGVVTAALESTVATAGRTVTFSAVTVAVSISGLFFFRPAILQAIGAAGVGVVLVAVATALTLVPALLRLSGRALHRPSLIGRIPGLRALLRRTADVRSDEGTFSRLAARVQRHPLLWMLGALGALVVLALPVRGLEMRTSGIEMLPSGTEQRQFVELMADQYPATNEPSVAVVASTSLDRAEVWTDDLVALRHVESVDDPQVLGSVVVIGVRPDSDDPGGDAATAVVTQIRALHPGFQTWVVGQAANQLDFLHAIQSRLWWAVGLVAAATLVLIFLLSGSVVIAIKALITNALSLGASLGVLVWGFQYGYLEKPLGFTSAGGIETYVLVMVVAFAFGLAMDYEVFLLSRVLELHDAGVDDREAVRTGLQRSARIITSAAAIVVVVFAGFVSGKLLVIKEVGFGLAVAVIIDATLVRMILVPATMSLLGKANWWAPKFLKRMRLAVAEH